MWMQSPLKPEEGISSPVTGFTGYMRKKPARGCWESNAGLPEEEEQSVLLTAEPSLLPEFFLFCKTDTY